MPKCLNTDYILAYMYDDVYQKLKEFDNVVGNHNLSHTLNEMIDGLVKNRCVELGSDLVRYLESEFEGVDKTGDCKVRTFSLNKGDKQIIIDFLSKRKRKYSLSKFINALVCFVYARACAFLEAPDLKRAVVSSEEGKKLRRRFS